MQVKIVIGTVAFMLTMVVMGYAALREPARMETFTNMYEARSIESGGTIFHSNCATCHGENGRAEECYNAEGEQEGCKGLPLNRAELLCGNPSPRMEAMQWLGSKHAFVAGTVTSGRSQNGMPTWGADFGGSLEPYEVEYVTKYVLNWETEDMCSQPTPTPVPWPQTVAELPAGNAAAGQELFEITYGCAACHGFLAEEGSNATGPWVGNFKTLDNTRVDGYSAADYVYESVLLPNAFISPDCPTGACGGPPSAMPDNFGVRLSLQDMADIMTYVLETDALEGNQTIVYPAP